MDGLGKHGMFWIVFGWVGKLHNYYKKVSLANCHGIAASFFPSLLSVFHRSFTRVACSQAPSSSLHLWHPSGIMQRGFRQWPAPHPKLRLCVDYELWLLSAECWIFLLASFALSFSHAIGFQERRKLELPEVSANLCCAISLTHCCIQKPESKPAIVPATTLAENGMGPRPDEVRWLVHVLRSDLHMDSAIGWKLAKRCSNKNKTKTDYTMTTAKEVLTSICSFYDSSSVSKEVIGVALKIIQICEVRWFPSLKVATRLMK